MKKIFTVLGGVVAAAAIFTVIAVILKKIKLSFSVEFADGDDTFECSHEQDVGDNVAVSFEPKNKKPDDEDLDFDENIDDEIEVEFTDDGDLEPGESI